MSSFLADTNILLRWVQPRSAQHEQAVAAVEALRRDGHTVSIAPQCIIEFWSVASRPLTANGLDIAPQRLEDEVARIESIFPLLPDGSAIYAQWRHLVSSLGVVGPQVHDARLVALMLVHGVTHVLTFDTDHFRRYPGITVVHPGDVVAADASGS
jgi:predicted nucleic acid-binding protein